MLARNLNRRDCPLGRSLVSHEKALFFNKSTPEPCGSGVLLSVTDLSRILSDMYLFRLPAMAAFVGIITPAEKSALLQPAKPFVLIMTGLYPFVAICITGACIQYFSFHWGTSFSLAVPKGPLTLRSVMAKVLA